MLDWSMLDLSAAAQVSVSTIKRIEDSEEITSSMRSLLRIQVALEAKGINFETAEGRGRGLWMEERAAIVPSQTMANAALPT